jgi:hypothetical protein
MRSSLPMLEMDAALASGGSLCQDFSRSPCGDANATERFIPNLPLISLGDEHRAMKINRKVEGHNG